MICSNCNLGVNPKTHDICEVCHGTPEMSETVEEVVEEAPKAPKVAIKQPKK